MEQPLIIPAPLKEGDLIAIVSPSGTVKAELVTDAAEVLRRHGWRVRIYPHALGKWRTYSGTPEERFSDLSEALLDPEVKAILCSRGGYGAVHLLTQLSALPLRDNPKWIIGYSDISALHALMHRNGIASIHAPMAKHLSAFEGKDDDSQALFDLLTGKPFSYEIPANPLNRPGTAEGPLAGGNLAVIADLISTPYDVIRPGCILFIEDIAEPVYKTERILYQLKLSGVLARIKGLIVGAFTEYNRDVDGHTMDDMIHRMVAEYDYPVAFGVPVGHIDHNLPLPVSFPTRLTGTPQSTTIAFLPAITDTVSEERAPDTTSHHVP